MKCASAWPLCCTPETYLEPKRKGAQLTGKLGECAGYSTLEVAVEKAPDTRDRDSRTFM